MEHYIGDEDKDAMLLADFIQHLNICGCLYSLEDLTQLFEFVISPSDRKITGAIYTPDYIRDRIVAEVTAGYGVKELANKRFADIACGCGGFFLTITELLHRKTWKSYTSIYRDNIFGIDIQDYSIERTKLLLSLLALMNGEDADFTFNLYQANTLSFDFGRILPLDIVVGNPPYVCARNMSDESRTLLSNWRVCASGNSDLYIPFFQIAIENVRDAGRVGFITMNSFMTSLNGRALREYFQEQHNDIRIVDFRGYQMFPGKNAYTCLFFLTRNNSETIRYCTNTDAVLPENFHYENIPYEKLDAISGWKLNDITRIMQIEKIGTPLGRYCQTRHGIATLANKVYVFQPLREEGDMFVFEKDGVEHKIEREVCRCVVNSNKLNSDVKLDDIIEQVIYPYRLNIDGKIDVIDENTMQHHFKSAYSYLSVNRAVLENRDKGHTEKYSAWYAYGRTQSLVMPRYKLFFPKIANKQLRCVLCDDADLLLYNGISFVSDDESQLQVLKRIMESSIFWEYITLNSKPYSSNYYSITGLNIKYFGVPNLTSKEIRQLLKFKSQTQIDNYLRKFYE
jgi:hypothetical protein